MANLMVRTELPRAQIERWLDEMQRDAKFTTPDAEPPQRKNRDGKPHMLRRAKALEREIVSEVIKARLGVEQRTVQVGKPRRSIKIGALLGLLFPPAGLAYAAPWKVTVMGSVIYLPLAWLSIKFAFLGTLFGLLLPVHLFGAVLGAGYAWRFNRKGRRAPLLPNNDEEEGSSPS